jgi:hypothetical protein
LDKTNDVVQEGTHQDVNFTTNGHGTYYYTTDYYAWIEWANDPSLRLAGTVLPGDIIYADVWVGDAAGNKNPAGGNAWFYMENNDWAIASTCIGPGASCVRNTTLGQVFQGNSAEAIMEGGLFGSTFYPLANYGTSSMWFDAFDSSNTQHTLHNTTYSNKNLFHASNGDLMSSATIGSGLNVTLSFVDYQ